MSARRWFGIVALAFGAAAAAAGTAAAQGSVVARVGGELAGRVGDTLVVPITVDMTGAPGVRLGSYRATIRFNPALLWFLSGGSGTFSDPLANEDSAGFGVLRFTAVQPAGADGVVVLGVARFLVASDTGASAITLAFDEMSAALTFQSLLPILTVVNGTFCRAAGTWGDVDGDGHANSRDALVALSKVVGLALDTLRLVEIRDSTGALIRVDTVVTMRPGLADVDGDGLVTSRDALIIVSHAVGLPVPGFRIGLAAAGGCASGLGITLAAAPDTLELQTGQVSRVLVSALDASGHAASLTGATWTSSNTAVAGALAGFSVEARTPGVAILTVELGAGYRASMAVKVVAQRTRWFVNRLGAHPVIQTGAQPYPFAFITDALDRAHDGDTVEVAPGVYEEMVAGDVSVLLRGDPADPAVIDARGAAVYGPGTVALAIGSHAAPTILENLHVVTGPVQVLANGFVGRNLWIGGTDSTGTTLYVATYSPGATAPPAGPRLDAGFPGIGGNVLLDSVIVNGWSWNGIEVAYADTVTVRRSVVRRDSTYLAAYGAYFPACGGDGPAGIYVHDVQRTDIAGTTVRNAPCGGMGVLQFTGSVRLSGNTVDRAGGVGIVSAAPVIALDHNLVTRIISGSWTAPAAGISIFPEVTAQSVTSVGDVLRGMGDVGFAVQGARSVVIDSLRVDTTGIDGTYTSSGVGFSGGHLTVRNSRITNTLGGVGIFAWKADTSRSVVESRHNFIAGTGGDGIYTSQYAPGGPCGGGPCAPPIQRGPMGGFAYGPDTLISVGDTIRLTGGSGIHAESGVYALVDSAVVDSAGYNGVWLSSVWYGMLSHSRILRPYLSGFYTEYADSAHVLRSRVAGAGSSGLDFYETGPARVYGSAADSNGSDGVYMRSYSLGAALEVDSSRFAANGYSGFRTTMSYGSGAFAVLSRSTVSGNSVGLVNDGGYTSVVRNSNIAGNTWAGARNQDPGRSFISADTNWWGDANGPRCAIGVMGCDTVNLSLAGDSIVTQGVGFAGWLTGPATGVMTAPANLRPVAARLESPTPLALARPARPAAAGATTPRVLTRPSSRAPALPRGPLMTWRKGERPRPTVVHHPN